jgi:hypothetical protein
MDKPEKFSGGNLIRGIILLIAGLAVIFIGVVLAGLPPELVGPGGGVIAATGIKAAGG